MDLRKEFEKERGHDCYAYLQKYAGANKEQDGFNDEYVEWLESKVNSVVLGDVSNPLAPKEIENCMKCDLKLGGKCKEHCGASWC